MQFVQKSFVEKNSYRQTFVWDISLRQIPYCSDVIMSAMASQITGVSVVCSIVCSNKKSKKTSKLSVTGLCEGNPPMTAGFLLQRASNAENVSIISDDVIMRRNGVVKPKALGLDFHKLNFLWNQNTVTLQIWSHCSHHYQFYPRYGQHI